MNNIEQFIINYNSLKSKDLFARNTSITITANTPCNLACKYCYVMSCTNQQLLEFKPEKLEPVLKTFSNRTNENIGIWAGEPLFSKELFVNLCELINKNLPNHDITIYTNGTLLNDWWADFFKEHQVLVKISHDGPGQKFRGPDYLKSETQVKALQKMYENGSLCGVNTTIHKYNCSFNDIINYFAKFEKESGIKFTTQSRCQVGLNLANEIVYNFDEMDTGLFNFIVDTYTFLFKKLLNSTIDDALKYFPADTILDTLPILRLILGLPTNNENDTCYKKAIAIDGSPFCVYGVYGKNLPDECYSDQHTIHKPPLKCSSCIMFDVCPYKTCLRVSSSNDACEKSIIRYKTIRAALEYFIQQIQSTGMVLPNE